MEGKELLGFAEDAKIRFESIYERRAPWDIPYPQPSIVDVAKEGWVHGRVLDVGCGTGENALYLASLGFEVYGIDISPSAIGMAKEKARKRGYVASRFIVADALSLQSLGITFHTIIDCGFFHSLSDQERPLYVNGLLEVVCIGGVIIILCFSDKFFDENRNWGPRHISKSDIEETFSKGFSLVWIKDAFFHRLGNPDKANAYLALLRKDW